MTHFLACPWCADGLDNCPNCSDGLLDYFEYIGGLSAPSSTLTQLAWLAAVNDRETREAAEALIAEIEESARMTTYQAEEPTEEEQLQALIDEGKVLGMVGPDFDRDQLLEEIESCEICETYQELTPFDHWQHRKRETSGGLVAIDPPAEEWN